MPKSEFFECAFPFSLIRPPFFSPSGPVPSPTPIALFTSPFIPLFWLPENSDLGTPMIEVLFSVLPKNSGIRSHSCQTKDLDTRFRHKKVDFRSVSSDLTTHGLKALGDPSLSVHIKLLSLLFLSSVLGKPQKIKKKERSCLQKELELTSGSGWGQQFFSFHSPVVQWMARTSSLNCLSCRLIHWIASPLFTENPFFSLKSASSHPLPQNWLWFWRTFLLFFSRELCQSGDCWFLSINVQSTPIIAY